MKIAGILFTIILLVGFVFGQPTLTTVTTFSGTGIVSSYYDNPYEVSGYVTNVVDGDTIDVNVVENDFRTTKGESIRVRFADIDCPETRGKKACQAGRDAKNYTTKMLINQDVWLDLDDKTGMDEYDRWVAVLYIDGRNFNKELVDTGFADIKNFSNNEFDPKTW